MRGLPDARYNFDVGSHGEQTAKMLTGIEKVLQKEKPEKRWNGEGVL
jgi:UDP-N-acetylglucosamine 2-epimerase (non-hydrolysing)